MRNGNLLKSRVSGICVIQICINQGVGVFRIWIITKHGASTELSTLRKQSTLFPPVHSLDLCLCLEFSSNCPGPTENSQISLHFLQGGGVPKQCLFGKHRPLLQSIFIKTVSSERSVNLRKEFWCLQISHKTKQIFEGFVP